MCGLARYLTCLRLYDWDNALAAIGDVAAGAESAELLSVVSVEQARLSHEVAESHPVAALYERALNSVQSVSAPVALAEMYGIETGHISRR